MKSAVAQVLLCAGAATLAAHLGGRPDAHADDEFERRLARIEAAVERLAPRPHAETARALLAPSVAVSARGGSGAGTIVSSHPDDGTFVLTAWHVVAKAVQRDDEEREVRQPVKVTVYRPDERRLEADVVAWHEKKDVALLRLRSRDTFPAARLSRAAADVLAPVYAVGCPLGHDPLPTAGEITSLRKEVQGVRFWMMSAPTIYGNSGGGVFHRETLEFLGVSVMLCTYDNPSTTPVPHLGVFLPLDSIAAWLAEAGHANLIRREY